MHLILLGLTLFVWPATIGMIMWLTERGTLADRREPTIPDLATAVREGIAQVRPENERLDELERLYELDAFERLRDD